jgi:phage gp45-like
MSSTLDRLTGRLLSLCGFGRITATTALTGKGLRRAQVRIDDAEIRDETPMVGLYGVASRPLPGADAIMIFLAGDRSKSIIIATNDRRVQIDLAEGEVALHTDEGDHIHFKRGGLVSLRASTRLDIDTPLITSTGRIEAAGDVKAGSVSLQNHSNTGVQAGSSLSGPPQA